MLPPTENENKYRDQQSDITQRVMEHSALNRILPSNPYPSAQGPPIFKRRVRKSVSVRGTV